MTVTNYLLTQTAERPFATTAEKYTAEYASGKVTGSNFPYREVHSLTGYTKRNTPGLAAVDVTNELTRHLAEYAERNGCPLPYRQREMSQYLWIQASRGMLDVGRDPTRSTRDQEEGSPSADRRLLRLPRNYGNEGNRKGQETHQADPVHQAGGRLRRMPDGIPV